jgi:hypothetical protein
MADQVAAGTAKGGVKNMVDLALATIFSDYI